MTCAYCRDDNYANCECGKERMKDEMKPKTKHIYEGYGVRLTDFLAYGPPFRGILTHSVFLKQTDAISYNKELTKNGCKPGKVVRVRVTYEVLSK
jgi:hypothetical protein